ncbi:hypothetical protein [Aeromicrobium marinum]|nr:hypothetical protein [Aeromicrobium marinum]
MLSLISSSTVLALASLSAACGSGGFADEVWEPASSRVSGEGLDFEAVPLSFPVSWEDATELLEEMESGIGLRYSRFGSIGEVFGKSSDDLDLVARSIADDQGALPPVTHILVQRAIVRDDSRPLDDVSRTSRSLPPYQMRGSAPESGSLLTRAREVIPQKDQLGRTTAISVSDGSGPEEWAPPATEVIAEDGEVAGDGPPLSANTIDMWMQWPSSVNRIPESVPQGWVLEAEVNTFSGLGLNPGGLFQRPFCPTDGNDAYFWSGFNPNFSVDPGGNFLGWSMSTLNTSLDPEAYGAYLDYNLLFDNCDRKALGIGIAYPQDAPFLLPGDSQSRGFIVSLYLPQGLEESSAMSAGYQLVTNDCTGEVSTNCTGIDSSTGAMPPLGYSTGSPAMNLGRGFTVPGCYARNFPSDPIEQTCF